mgnify:CR=1 FL=1
MKKTRLLNTYVNNITMDEAVDFLLQKIRKRDPAYVIEINVDVVVKMEHDPELRHISDDADLTLVDGQPLLWIARWYSFPSFHICIIFTLLHRTCISDYFIRNITEF